MAAIVIVNGLSVTEKPGYCFSEPSSARATELQAEYRSIFKP